MRRFALPLAGFALLLSACSGDDAGAPPGTATSTATPATQAQPTPGAATASPSSATAASTSTSTTTTTATPPGATPAPSAPSGATPAATAQATAVPPTAAPTSAPEPKNVTIALRDNYFDPAQMTVPRGSTVTWVWQGNEFHNVVGDGFGVQGTTKTGSYSFTFTTAGTFPYVCQVHENSRPQMVGTITVQ